MYDAEDGILTPIPKGSEDNYTRGQRISAGDMLYDPDAVVERQQAAQNAANAEFEARRIEAAYAVDSAEDAEQNTEY
jgi:hypothetical protein